MIAVSFCAIEVEANRGCQIIHTHTHFSSYSSSFVVHVFYCCEWIQWKKFYSINDTYRQFVEYECDCIRVIIDSFGLHKHLRTITYSIPHQKNVRMHVWMRTVSSSYNALCVCMSVCIQVAANCSVYSDCRMVFSISMLFSFFLHSFILFVFLFFFSFFSCVTSIRSKNNTIEYFGL